MGRGGRREGEEGEEDKKRGSKEMGGGWHCATSAGVSDGISSPFPFFFSFSYFFFHKRREEGRGKRIDINPSHSEIFVKT
jgi:hypothetical protein